MPTDARWRLPTAPAAAATAAKQAPTQPRQHALCAASAWSPCRTRRRTACVPRAADTSLDAGLHRSHPRARRTVDEASRSSHLRSTTAAWKSGLRSDQRVPRARSVCAATSSSRSSSRRSPSRLSAPPRSVLQPPPTQRRCVPCVLTRVCRQRTLWGLERELLEERRMRNHCEAEASRWRAEAERLALLLAAKRPHALSSTPSTLSLSSSSSPDGTPDAPAAAASAGTSKAEGETPEDDGDENEKKEDDDEDDIMAGLRKSVAEAQVVAGDSQRTEGTNDCGGDHEEKEEEDVEALASSFRCFSVVELPVCLRDLTTPSRAPDHHHYHHANRTVGRASQATSRTARCLLAAVAGACTRSPSTAASRPARPSASTLRPSVPSTCARTSCSPAARTAHSL